MVNLDFGTEKQESVANGKKGTPNALFMAGKHIGLRCYGNRYHVITKR